MDGRQRQPSHPRPARNALPPLSLNPKPMKTWLRWLLPAVALLIALGLGAKWLKGRKAADGAPAAAAAAAASAAAPTLELAAQDLLTVQPQRLTRGLEVSGSLKAVNSAFVKARVGSEKIGRAHV